MKTPLQNFGKLLLCLTVFICTANLYSQTNAWINEIHYEDNGSPDTNETIEIVIENPGMLSSYEIVLYRDSGTIYDDILLNDPDINIGTTAGNFTIYTWSPSGGIQNGPADGIALTYNGMVVQFLSYDGTMTASEGPANGLTSTDIGVNEDSSALSSESLQLSGIGAQYNDFIWNVPATSTFGLANTSQSLSGNSGPAILNITQAPVAGNVTSSDAVSVSANITDSDGVTSVSLNWGTSSGNLTSSITMSLGTGSTYITNSNIPAQANGTMVYYEISATDSNTTPTNNTSVERSYTVIAPQPEGLQVLATDTPYIIDFETNVPNVNNGQFAGNGFQQVPSPGQLDSNSWAITGMSDGDLPFDGLKVSGDFARGSEPGGVGTGGIYAFETSSGNYSLGVQPGGSDFEPGSITLKIQNQTGTTITDLEVKYSIFVYNDQGRSNSFNFSHSSDNTAYTPEISGDYISDEAADTAPAWKEIPMNINLSGLSIAPDSFYYLRWTGDEVAGGGNRDEFSLDNIVLVANKATTNYVYNGTTWIPSDPSGVATDGDNITVQSGVTNLTADTHINDLTINANAVLNIEQALLLEGNIVNNGSLVFINDATKLGQLGKFYGTINGSGETTVQRYVPARRAFRFVSSAVTTTTSIHDNWQEGVNNTGTNYPADNLDPNPGFGTHITGSATGANGFDATISGNPSLMTFDNTNPTQPWNFVPNTNVLTLDAGKAYNLFVRGDRSIDLTNNGAVPTNTTLRATGSLHVGDYTDSNLSQDAGEFNFIGNPYQAIVDMNKVLENSTNINDGYYWVWDPTESTKGSYVLVNLPGGLATPSASDANQFLQPGQAAFVVTLSSGASILFEESDKNVAAEPTEVFKTFPTDYIDLVMYESSAFLNDGPAADGFLVKFSPGENNAVDFRDALKWFNPDENIALTNNGNYLIMENRDLPTSGEVLQLYNNNYRHTSYTFKIEVNGLENYTVYLNDNYLGTQTQLASGTNQINFSVDQNISASTASDRFYLSFQNLSIEKQKLAGFVVYPNPINNGAFTISSPGFSEKANVVLYNLLGRKVHQEKADFSIENKIEVNTEQLQTGIYTLKLETESGKSFAQKLIVE